MAIVALIAAAVFVLPGGGRAANTFEGVLVVGECWDFASSVGVYPRTGFGLRGEKYLAAVQRSQFLLVIVDQNNVVPEVRETRARD